MDVETGEKFFLISRIALKILGDFGHLFKKGCGSNTLKKRLIGKSLIVAVSHYRFHFSTFLFHFLH